MLERPQKRTEQEKGYAAKEKAEKNFDVEDDNLHFLNKEVDGEKEQLAAVDAQIDRLRERTGDVSGEEKATLLKEITAKMLEKQDLLFEIERIKKEIGQTAEILDEVEENLEKTSEAFKKHLN